MTSEKFVARQPILNKNNKTVAYELLFRNSNKNSYPLNIDSNTATRKTIYNSFLEIGLDEISSGKKLLINIDEISLNDDLIFDLPTNKISLEILENIPCTDQNIKRISRLKKYGFEIALDDFILTSENAVLLKYCSLVKIDIQNTPVSTILKDLEIYKEKGIKILAEKVETKEEYRECLDLGFHYFQGYFFNKPEIISAKQIESQKHVVLMAYKAIITEETFSEIAKKISCDVGLSERFLRYANVIITKKSTRCTKITSVLQALSFIGKNDAKRFFNVMMLDLIDINKPMEIVDQSMIRAYFLKSLFENKETTMRDKAYLAGFFYHLDVLLDKDINVVLASLNLHEDIENAILKKEGLIGLGLNLAEAIERGDFEEITRYSKELNICVNLVNLKYQNAIKWRNKIMKK